MTGLRLVVVDDHHLFRAGVRSELATHFEIVGDAEAPAEAIAVITSAAPDVVLLDVHLPGGGGVAVLRALAGAGLDPEPRVLALSVSDAAEDVVPMIRAGALGYVTKTIGTGELVGAIERVAAGDAYFSPRLAAFVLQAFSAPDTPVAAAEDELGARRSDPVYGCTMCGASWSYGAVRNVACCRDCGGGLRRAEEPPEPARRTSCAVS